MMSPRSPALSARLASQWFEVWVAAPQVIAMRMAQMLTPAWTDAARRTLAAEMHLMTSEKVTAAVESSWAAAAHVSRWQAQVAAQAWRAALTAPAALAQGRLPALATPGAASMQRMASSALRPVHRRVTANARRLRKQLRED